MCNGRTRGQVRDGDVRDLKGLGVFFFWSCGSILDGVVAGIGRERETSFASFFRV